MKKIFKSRITEIFILLIILFVIYTIFFTSIRYIQQGNYILYVEKAGKELTVISGDSHLGETFVVDKNRIDLIIDGKVKEFASFQLAYNGSILENKYVYSANYVFIDGYEGALNLHGSYLPIKIDFIRNPNTSNISASNGSISQETVGYSNVKEETKPDDFYQVMMVYLELRNFYKVLTFFFIVFVFALGSGLYIYFDSNRMHNRLCKAFKTEYLIISEFTLKVLALLLPVFVSLFLFILI